MNRKGTWFAAGFASSALLFSVGFYLYGSNEKPVPEPSLPDRSKSITHDERAGQSNPADSRSTRERPPVARSDGHSAIKEIESLSAANPKLAERFQLFLFDSDLKPIEDDWDLLGVDKDSVGVLAADLKRILDDIKNYEFENFDIRSTSEHQVELALPAMNEEESSRRLAQIESSFSQIFGPEGAKTMTAVFLRHHAAKTAGITGRDRVVRVRSLDSTEAGTTTDRFAIDTYILFEGNKLTNIEGDVSRYASLTVMGKSSEIPESWRHLFEEEKP